MSSQTQKVQKVALPAYLPKRLVAFRVGEGANQSYLLRDKLQNKTYDFEPWQFFVLEILPGCEDYAKLASVFEDRFGYPIKREQVDELLASVADNKLFEDCATHPLLAPFSRKGYETEDGKAKVKSFRSVLPKGKTTASEGSREGQDTPSNSKGKPSTEEIEEDLPAGLQDTIDFDPRVVKKMWTLFDPRPMLKLMTPFVSPLKYSVYVLPLIVSAAILLAIQYSHLIHDDMNRLLGNTTVFGHVLFSMFTVNLLVTLTTVFVAHTYRTTVSAFGITLYMRFLPRFIPRISHVRQLSRNERMWLHAAPLIMRLYLFSLGILIWYNTRVMNGLLPQLGLALSVICALGLLFSANPLVKGSGYHLLAAFINEPHLQGKSYKALLNKLRSNVYREADSSFLAAYAVASFAFMFVVLVVVVFVLGRWLHTIQLGGTAIILSTTLGIVLIQQTIKRLKRIEEAYERSVQFDRWRNRTLPTDTPKDSDKTDEQKGWPIYVKRVLLLTLLIVMFLPYPYEAGGSFTIFPDQRQELATDIPGIVDNVYFDGGETLKKGTVIARLAYDDYQAKVALYTAKMQEQQAIVDDLKARPKPEEVKVAERDLDVARTREAFSKEKLARTDRLYKEDTVSYEELATQQREHQVDVEQIAEKLAALELVKTGVTKDQIAAAQAKWESLKAERDSYIDKINRSVLTMPFDGTLLTLHLKQKTNSFLEKGKVFAVVENSSQMTAEIEVPQSDVRYVLQSAKVRVRPMSYDDDVYPGVVTTIDRNITATPAGNVVKVVAQIDNKDWKLKTGMTGYAKIEGESMPVWKAFSLAVTRFINIQVWSWIP